MTDITEMIKFSLGHKVREIINKTSCYKGKWRKLSDLRILLKSEFPDEGAFGSDESTVNFLQRIMVNDEIIYRSDFIDHDNGDRTITVFSLAGKGKERADAGHESVKGKDGEAPSQSEDASHGLHKFAGCFQGLDEMLEIIARAMEAEDNDSSKSLILDSSLSLVISRMKYECAKPGSQNKIENTVCTLVRKDTGEKATVEKYVINSSDE